MILMKKIYKNVKMQKKGKDNHEVINQKKIKNQYKKKILNNINRKEEI